MNKHPPPPCMAAVHCDTVPDGMHGGSCGLSKLGIPPSHIAFTLSDCRHHCRMCLTVLTAGIGGKPQELARFPALEVWLRCVGT
jgi:hypothetical protein